MTEKHKKLLDYYHDKANWRPPPYRKLMEIGGFKSKNSVHKIIKKQKI